MAESLPTKKSPRLIPEEEDDNIDRFSSLPECIRLQILSLLNLKEAATTSVLSTSWKDLFLQLPDIHLTFRNGNPYRHPIIRLSVNRLLKQLGIKTPLSVDENGSEHHNALFHRFTLFAHRVLQHRNQEEPIASLKLCVEAFTESFLPDLDSLLLSIAAAVSTYEVKELHVTLGTEPIRVHPCFVDIPPEIFLSETLAGLRLNIWEYWDVPDFVWLPKIRYLHLISFRLEDDDSIQRLLNGCPMLENLVMRFSKDSEIPLETFSLFSSSLKFLTIGWDVKDPSKHNIVVTSESLERLTFFLHREHVNGGHNVNVDAPNLKYLSITGQVCQVNIIRSFVSLKEAFIDADYVYELLNFHQAYLLCCQNASIFFGALQGIQILNLSENIIQVINSETDIPTFENLHTLRLIPGYGCGLLHREYISQLLLNLLEKCANLEVISFHKVFNNYFGGVEFDNIFPITFLEHVKEIEILNFKGRELEYNLVEFFLNKALSLEILCLGRDQWKSKQRKKILSFKRYSEECEIIFQ